jgi:hypothetical protein
MDCGATLFPTSAILDHLRDLGWLISTHRVNGTIEYHAILARDPDEYQIARCNDGDGPNEEYRAACLLAEACGVDLDDG